MAKARKPKPYKPSAKEIEADAVRAETLLRQALDALNDAFINATNAGVGAHMQPRSERHGDFSVMQIVYQIHRIRGAPGGLPLNTK